MMQLVRVPRFVAVLLAAALLTAGGSAAGSEVQTPPERASGPEGADWFNTGVPANIGGTHGWYATGNTGYGFLYSVECKDNPLGNPNIKVKVFPTIWANGARIKGIQFKARLVPEGTDGQLQLPYAWSENQSVSFPTNTRASYNFARGLPRVSSDSDWDIEVKFKFPRSFRDAFRYKFRVEFDEVDCRAIGGP